eukprot:CCRYP_010911-RB/>CCRYP_010911-RB protein AED:0.05 eAED:0.05 QI:68/1/1/1/0.5/0.4/5/297/1361
MPLPQNSTPGATMEGRSHPYPHASSSSSGIGSNLNNMICNFSRGDTNTAQKNGATSGNSANTSNINDNMCTDSRLNFVHRAQSDHASAAVENMSKSMGNSFVMSLRERVSDELTPETSIIRHAGYLLKRSNFPYAMTSSSVLVASNNVRTPTETGVSLIHEPPLIENVIRDFPLPDLNDLPGDSQGRQGHVNMVETQNGVIGYIGDDEPPMRSHSTNFVNERPCFCSPIVKYFEVLFGKRGVHNAISESDNSTNVRTLKRGSPPDLPISPRPTPRLPSAPPSSSPPAHLNPRSSNVNYNIPLKSPVRSIPVPISSQMSRPSISRQPQRTGSTSQLSSRNLSRSYSNGSKLNIAAMVRNANGSASITNIAYKQEKKVYPPPPEDYIDPKDGHIWRAKYCVLEDGILYFYRNAEEGESDEAQAERNESKFESLNAMEGTGFDYEWAASSPKRSSLIGYASNGTTASAGVGVPGRTMTRDTRQTSCGQDLHDLSKSPMPYRKSDIFDFALRKSGSNLSETQGNTPLHYSHSTSTFNHDGDILWEKRVALDCVGAVRSSEQDHGKHAFELLAFGMDDRAAVDEMSDASSARGMSFGGKGHSEIVDRLILRAGDSDDMNNWMFQFHRSLAFYMQQIVNSVKRGDSGPAYSMDLFGGQRHNTIHRPDSPILHHRRLPTPLNGGKGLTLSPFVARQSSSPTTNSFGGSLTASNIPGSLSHGHGRNALYRRQVRDNKYDTSLISPVSTPGGGSSPVDEKKSSVASLQKMTVAKSQNGAAAITAFKLDVVTKDTAPKKYIPPHRRNEQNTKRYLPPHERKKDPQTDSKRQDERDVTLVPPLPQMYEEPLTDGEKDVSDHGNDSLSGSATSSLLSKQIDDVDSVSLIVNVRLGGCADPTVVVGSILDHHYISRKASVVGNVRLEAYGGHGGGFFVMPGTEEAQSLSSRRRVLKWEIGAASECGVRDSNEDSYVAINNLDELIKSQDLVSFADQDFGETYQQGLYAIFDGHVGNQAARFAAEKFPNILIEEQSALASRDSASLRSIETRTDLILRSAFERLDKDFCNLCTTDGRDWDCGSTALVALIVDDVVTLANLGDCRGVVCRMVLSREVDLDGWENLDADNDDDLKWDRAASGGNTERSEGRLFWKEMTETHSPLLSEERARIKNANGWIVEETEIPTGQLHRMDFFDKDVVEIVKRCFADRLKQHRSDPVRQIHIARTCGDLAVSRAIGDRDFKAAYNMPSGSLLNSVEEKSELAMSWEGPKVFIYPDDHSGRFKGDLVSNKPDIKFFKIGQKGVADEFLLMACDGLWDVMDGDDAVRIAKDLLFDKKLSAKDGAARLAELAKHLGSSDNITVILIRFYWEVGDGQL